MNRGQGRRIGAGPGSRTVLALVWLVSAAYVWPFHARGWIPHDEGCLAQSAERVLEGQLPHRDFDEIYTGGLAYLDAAAMRVFGRELLVLRILLFGAFLAFVPILYLVARRFASPLVAGVATLTGVAWSFPNYFAGLPSWYNLIFALLGTLLVLKHVETGRRSFLFLAGICAGLSFLVKLVALYFVFGVLFFLLYREAQLAGLAEGPRRRGSPMLLLKGALALATPVALLVLLRDRWRPMEIVHFAVPASAIALFVFWDEARSSRPVGVPRVRRLAALAGPFILGAVAPVALFLLLYLPGGAVPDFLRGVFLLPQRRLVSASMPMPPLSGLLPAVPYAFLLAAAPLGLGRRMRAALGALLVAALLALLLVSGQLDAYRVIWLSARSLGVVAVLVGCGWLALLPDTDRTSGARQKAFLLLAVAACVGLQQFPFAGPIYFCYFAPVVIAALLAVQSIALPRAREIHFAVLAFYLFFAVLRLNPGYVFTLGREFRPYVADARMDFGRAGLVVPRRDRDVYREVVSLVAEKSRGSAIYAGPDCPEVYFMADRRNLTRAILEFNSASPTRGLPLPAFLKENGVNAIVINHAPAFSMPLEPSLTRALESEFPRARDVGQFEVRWRD